MFPFTLLAVAGDERSLLRLLIVIVIAVVVIGLILKFLPIDAVFKQILAVIIALALLLFVLFNFGLI